MMGIGIVSKSLPLLGTQDPGGQPPSRGPDRAPPDPGDMPLLLGDVVICPAVAARQAPTHAGTLEDEFALLVVHGLLHVLGHDHDDEAALAAMRPTDEFDHLTLQDAIDGLGASAMSRLVIGREVRTEFMLPPDQVSQRFAAQVASNQRADHVSTSFSGRAGDKDQLFISWNGLHYSIFSLDQMQSIKELPTPGKNVGSLLICKTILHR